MKQRHGDFSTPNDRLTLTSKKTMKSLFLMLPMHILSNTMYEVTATHRTNSTA